MHYWMVTKHVKKKNAGKPRTMFWWLMLFYTHLRLLLKPSELWLSIATFNNHENHRQSEFCVNLMYHESDPSYGGYPTLRG